MRVLLLCVALCAACGKTPPTGVEHACWRETTVRPLYNAAGDSVSFVTAISKVCARDSRG